MKIRMYQIDAFAEKVFEGNPAAVCPLEKWPTAKKMQAIAAENNLSETAFFTGRNGKYKIRWFTPAKEVDLCGHATLASAHVIFTRLERGRKEIVFASRSGPLAVRLAGGNGTMEMDFPAQTPEPCRAPENLGRALGGIRATETLRADDIVAVVKDEKTVREAKPDFAEMKKIDARGVMITARGKGCDFVVRFFAPRYGIDEDPVTGSAYCELVPYWARKLGKNRMKARQLSRRGGEIWCEYCGPRVKIAGRAVEYFSGTICV